MLTPLLGTLPTYSKAVVHDPSLTVQSSLSTDAHDAGSSSGTTIEVKDFKRSNGTHSSCRCDWTTIDDVCQQGRNRSQICSTMCCALEEQVRTGDGAQQQPSELTSPHLSGPGESSLTVCALVGTLYPGCWW